MCPNWKELPKGIFLNTLVCKKKCVFILFFLQFFSDNGADNNQKGIDRGFDEWGVVRVKALFNFYSQKHKKTSFIFFEL